MFLTFIILLSIVLAYFASTKKIKKGLEWSFILLGLVAAIRYNVGNDYLGYLNTYEEIISQPFNLGAIIRGEVWREPGWVVICYLFQQLGGFFSLVAFVSIVENLVFYIFIKKNVAREWWAFAVFLYTCTQSLYLLNLSMMRQGLASALFVWAFSYIEKRKIIQAALLCFIAWSIHKSAIALTPFLFMGFVPLFYKKSKVLAGFVALSIVLLFSGGAAFTSATEFVSDFDITEGYVDTYGKGNFSGNFGIGYIFYLIPTIISFFFLANAKATNKERMIVLLPCFVALIDPFSRVLPIVGRLGIYFEAFRVFAYPLIFSWIKNESLKKVCIACYVSILLYDYWIFFTASIYAPHYVTYQTIFSVLRF